MVVSRIAHRARVLAAALVLSLAVAAGCRQSLGIEPEVKTVFILLPGNDTVYLDVETGEVTSGPIVAGTDIDISVQFFTESGTPDSRVTELAYRMDITPADAGIVTFTRSTAFAGTLHKVSPGVTSMSLALVQLSDTSTLFARGIPVEIY